MKKLVLVILLLAALPGEAQPVTISFKVGSHLETEMTGISDHVETTHGPYSFAKLKKLTFTQSLPDTAAIQKLQQMGIAVYLNHKKVKNVIPLQQVTEPSPPSSTPTITQAPVSNVIESESELTASIGVGFGLDYGGIGMRATLFPLDRVSIFGALGYNLHEAGFNAGFDLNFTPSKRSTGFLSAMYGYNGVVLSQPYSSLTSKTFYGPSLGLGVKTRTRNGQHFWTFQMIYPVRDQDFYNMASEKPWPVLFSVGFNLGN